MTGQRILLELDGTIFTATLFSDKAPMACRSLQAQLPLEGEVIHAMYSGPICLMGDINLDDAPLENPQTFFNIGDLLYHPEHKEIGITYAATQFREPIGSVYVSYIGCLVDDDLTPLLEIGKMLRQTGAKKLILR